MWGENWKELFLTLQVLDKASSEVKCFSFNFAPPYPFLKHGRSTLSQTLSPSFTIALKILLNQSNYLAIWNKTTEPLTNFKLIENVLKLNFTTDTW